MRGVVVYSSVWLPEAHLVMSLLTREGIPAAVRNQMRTGLVGEVPVDDARIEVTVAAEHVAAAEALIRAQADGVDRPCPSCGEDNPPAFELCWSCGAELPPAPLMRRIK